MRVQRNKYEVEVKDVQFTSSTGVTSERTAIVRFYSDADKITRSQKFGFIEVATIYDSINNGDDILLDDFFVHNFSLVDYRKTFKIDDHELVELKNFSEYIRLYFTYICLRTNNCFAEKNSQFKLIKL